jgi:hypothetical protein
VGLRRHDSLGFAELADLAIQPLPAILLQEVLRDLLERGESTGAHGPRFVLITGRENANKKHRARTSSTTDQRIVRAQSSMHR